MIRMTEKRFKAYGNNFIAIDDNVENKTYYLNEDVDRIVDLLNSLVEENEQLKQEIKQYWKCRDKWKQEAKELKKENEQLRQQLQSVKIYCKVREMYE